MWKHLFLQEVLQQEQSTEGSMALSCGSCDLCSTCAREQGEPCTFPEKSRYSIEALGGDVGYLAKRYFDREILWMKDDVPPAYMILIGGLLIK